MTCFGRGEERIRRWTLPALFVEAGRGWGEFFCFLINPFFEGIRSELLFVDKTEFRSCVKVEVAILGSPS